MSLLSRLVAPRQQRQNVAFSEPFWSQFWERFQGGRAKSGAHVTLDRALQVTTVLACLRVIAEGVAQVPLNIMKARADGRGADVATDHPLQWVLHYQPNALQTSFEFLEQMIFHAGLCARFVARKNLVRGEIRELNTYMPHEVCIEQDQFRRLTYRVSTELGETRDLTPDEVWHLKGPSWNGWDGMEILHLAREAIGLSMAAEEAHALMHANGGQTSGIYSLEGTLSKDQYNNLRNWIETHISGENRFRPFVLDRNAKFTPTSMTGVDAEHLATREHQIHEVCRAFRVMPIMIGFTDKTSTYGGAEQLFLAHVVHTLMPWYRRIEDSINVNLLGRKAVQAGYYAKFNCNALLRGATASRAQFYTALWNLGAINPNEIRALEEMNPYDGGDTFRVQLNMTDATQPVPTDDGTGQSLASKT